MTASAPRENVDPAPNPHATAEQVQAAYSDTKLAQVLYHDWEAATYDDKWSISYDQRCNDYARGRFNAVVGAAVQAEHVPYDRALELGSGTGFFLLNLMLSGVATRGSVTDLSPGMVEVALRNATSLGLDVDGRVADAETIPYADNTFDLVVGHAVLHHIPNVEQALSECLRVLRPGGRLVFAGEPTTIGNRYARLLGRITWATATRLTKLPGLASWRKPQAELDESSRAAALEAVVDLHTFDPAELERMALRAGAIEVRAATEEFASALLGWPMRTLEAAVPNSKLGIRWNFFAFKSWQRLSALDEKILSKVLPRKLFYNVMITGVKPAGPVSL